MMKKQADNSGGLEKAISYLLIGGVVLSCILEIAGMVVFSHASGSMAILQDSKVFIHEHGFFPFIYNFLRTGYGEGAGLWLMTAGLIILILTPFLRVVLSAVHFAWKRDFKYVLITVFVLLVLTLSLTLH